MKTNYYKGLLLVFLTLCTFNKVVAQCVVTAYAQNITANCGTGVQTYDVVVEYTNKPATGNLRLRNSTGNITTATVASIGSTTYTFTGVTFNMGDGEQDVYVDFSANTSCKKYLHIPLFSCTSYPTNSTVGTYKLTVTNGKKYTISGSDEYVLNYNGDLTLKHDKNYLAAFKKSLFDNVEYFFYSCKPVVTKHPYLSECTVFENGVTGKFVTYTDNIPSVPNPDMKEISLGNNSDLILQNPNIFSENKTWVMPSVYDSFGADITIPANYFANGAPFSIQYLNQITATKTDNCGGGSVNFTSLFGGYPEFHSSNYTITNNGNGTLSTTSVALNGSFSLTGLANGASYNVTVTDVNGGQTVLSGTFCSAAATTSCSTCAAPTCPIAGPYTDLATASTISNHCSLMQTISTPVQTGNSYVSYYTVKTGSTGDLGVVISSGYGNVNPGTCDGIINRTAVLYSSPNTCATAGISPTSVGGTFYNPVWTGLTPNTTYIVKVTATMPGSFCQLQDQCASYYTPAPSCATCATPTCSATSITETTLALGRTNISTALATAGNVLQKTLIPGQSVTICVPVTVPAGSTALGFKQNVLQGPTGCGDPSEEVITYTLKPANCSGSGVVPTRTNASGVASGFNPEWDNIAAGNYVLCYTMNVRNFALCNTIDINGLGYYNIIPACTNPATPTINSVAASCSAAGTSTISNYNATYTYTFTPTGPTVGAGGAISGMTVGTSYTVTAKILTCTSSASATFSNAAILTTPTVPTITSGAATCSAAGTSTISNYNASYTYTFTPSGPSVGAGGLISGMTIGTTYTVTAKVSTCTSNASATFSNAAILTIPTVPTITSGAATCSAAGTSTISNYNASYTYTFTPSGPSVGAGGLISGMTIGTTYTVTAKVSTCTSNASATFSNAATQSTPVVPTINSVAATCSAAGTSTISNYNASYTYTFSPSGPTVGAGGLISGMIAGTSYTVTAKLGACTSVASFTFSNAITLVTPVIPTISSGVATCVAGGTSTISNYNASYTYTFTPSGPTVGAGGLISGMTTGTSYTVTAVLGICTSSSSASFSNAAALTKPTAILSGNTTICNGASTNLSVSFTGTQPWSLTYLEGSTSKTVSSSSSPLLISVSPSTTTIYTLVSVSDAICTNTASGTATVNVTPKTALVVSCGTSSPSSVTFNWNAISDASSYSYTYSINGGSPVTNTLPSGTTTLTVNGVVAGQNVSITITPIGSACATAGSGNCSASNCPLPVVNTINDVVVCGAFTTSAIPLSSPTPSVSFNWFNNNTAIGLGASGSGSTIPSFTTANVTSTQVATITVTASDGPCTGPAQTFKITVNPVKTPTFSVVTTICSGDAYALPTLSNEGITGTWFPAFDANQTKEYTFTPTNDVCALTAKLNITVNTSPTFTLLSAPSPICSGQDAVFTFKGSANATVTYKIDGGADLALLLDGSGNGTVTITNPAANVSLSTSNITLGSCSLAISNAKTVVVNPTPNFTSLTVNSPICSGATAAFAIKGTANATVTYTLDGGITTKTIVLDGSGNATVSITNASANATITLNAIGLGTCITPLTNTATIVVNTTPTVASLNATSPICAGQDAVFTVVGTANATVNYTVNSGNPIALVLDATGNGTILITNPATDVVVNLTTITLGSCPFTVSNTKTVVVNPTPSFTSLTVNSPICSGATAAFAIKGTANATVTYTLDGGITTKTIVLDASGNATVSITNASANATITLNSIGLGTCITPLTNTATIVVNTTPTVASLNATTPICAGQDAVFTVVGTANATVNYTVNSGTPIALVLDATGNGTILITNPATDVAVNLTTITLGSCPFTLSNSKTVVVKTLPTLGTITPKNTAVCSGLNADFDITGTPNATVTYTIDGGITTKTIVLDGSGKATITIPNVTSSITITLSNISNGLCSSTLSSSSTVTVNVKPTASLAGTATLCKGDAGSLIVTLTGAQPWNLTYTDGTTPATVTGITVSPYTIAITPDTNATYSLTAVNDANCVGTTSGSAIITVANPSVAISSGCQDSDYVLTAIPTDATGVTYAWYKGANLLPNTTSQIIVNANDTYKVVITSNGCTAEAFAIVTSTYCDIPKGISPNGDNLNDFFELSNLSVKKLEIFNRYGMKVYSKTNYKNEWDGKTDDGQELPDGTYYYVIEFESGKVKTGWVYKTKER